MTWKAAVPASPPVVLTWDDGPVDWPPYMLALLLGEAVDDQPVSLSPTGPFVLRPHDEVTVAAWLEQTLGAAISGERPVLPQPPEGLDV